MRRAKPCLLCYVPCKVCHVNVFRQSKPKTKSKVKSTGFGLEVAQSREALEATMQQAKNALSQGRIDAAALGFCGEDGLQFIILAINSEKHIIHSLNMSGTNIDDDLVLYHLAPALRASRNKIKELDLSNNSKVGCRGAQAILSIPGITRLCLDELDLREAKSDFFGSMLDQSDVEDLSIRNCHLPSETVATLASVMETRNRISKVNCEGNQAFTMENINQLLQAVCSRKNQLHISIGLQDIPEEQRNSLIRKINSRTILHDCVNLASDETKKRVTSSHDESASSSDESTSDDETGSEGDESCDFMSADSESDSESDDDNDQGEDGIDDSEETITKAFSSLKNNYFGDVRFDSREKRAAVTLNQLDWKRWIPVINEMAKLLRPEKTFESLVHLRIGCALMANDSEAESLIDIHSDVFKKFWRRGRAVISCIMQGGKTKRAIFYRGFIHGGVCNKHVVVLANSQRTAYHDMRSAVSDMNKLYKREVLKKMASSNKHKHGMGRKIKSDRNSYIPESVFLYTRLNQVENVLSIQNKSRSEVHFNIRLANVAGIRSLNDPFRGKLGQVFNSETTHLILDESHEAMTKTQFARGICMELQHWADVSFVTATPSSNFILDSKLGDEFTPVDIRPRPGYYLYGPNMKDPSKDSLDDDQQRILVVNHIDVDKFFNGNILNKKPSKHNFPYSSFPLTQREQKKREKERKKDQALEGENARSEKPDCIIPENQIEALKTSFGKNLDRSKFLIVLNDFSSTSFQKNRSINIGHGKIALWLAQHAINTLNKLQPKAKAKSKAESKWKRASIVTYSVYNHCRVDNRFGKPHIYMNSALCRHLATIRVGEFASKFVTLDAAEANSKCLITQRQQEDFMSYLKALKHAADVILKNADRKGRNVKGLPIQCRRDKRSKTRTYEFEVAKFMDIKFVLSFIQHLHETRMPKEDDRPNLDYRSYPLRIAIVGKQLLKQAINVESKDRIIQLTDLVYLQNPNSRIDQTRMLQALGRVNHGFNRKQFYTSAFAEQKLAEMDELKQLEHMRPKVWLPSSLKRFLFETPQLQRTAATLKSGSIPYFLDCFHTLELKGSVQANADGMRELEKQALDKTLKNLPRSKTQIRFPKVKSWVNGIYQSLASAKNKSLSEGDRVSIAKRLVALINNYDYRPDFDSILDICDNEDHATPTDRMLLKFLKDDNMKDELWKTLFLNQRGRSSNAGTKRGRATQAVNRNRDKDKGGQKKKLRKR